MKDWTNITSNLLKSPEMSTLRQFVNDERMHKSILPKKEEVLGAFKNCPYDKLKVVILGQDPYPNKGDAHGLAFSSNADKTPASLANIFKEIKIQLYPEEELNDLFKTNNLTSWANQGVLLLNRVLTLEENLSNSHKGKGWEDFTEGVIKKLSEDYPKPLVFVLWGNDAKILERYINKRHLVLTSPHPSPLAAHKGFYGNGHFKMIQQHLAKLYFEELRTMVINEYHFDDLAIHIHEWMNINHLKTTIDSIKTVLLFLNGNIGEYMATVDPEIKSLYEINFRTHE
jgi:uracil-DNA glycosylase